MSAASSSSSTPSATLAQAIPTDSATMRAHVALLLAQVIGSFNSVLSRAAFTQPDEHVPAPLTFAVWRVLIASSVLFILRCFLIRPVTSTTRRGGDEQEDVDEEGRSVFKQEGETEGEDETGGDEDGTGSSGDLLRRRTKPGGDFPSTPTSPSPISNNTNNNNNSLNDFSSSPLSSSSGSNNNNNNNNFTTTNTTNNDINNNNSENNSNSENNETVIPYFGGTPITTFVLTAAANSTPNSPASPSGTSNSSSRSSKRRRNRRNSMLLGVDASKFWFASLRGPAPQPPVKAILQVCALGGILITANFAFFFFGVAFTDAITLAAMMCTIPPICFTLGYFLGLESFTVPKALATLLIVGGNLVMASAWRLFLPHSSTSSSSISSSSTSSSEHDNSHHHHHHSSKNGQYLLGVFFLFLAFSAWSLYLLLQRKVAQQMHVIDFLFYLYTSALVGLLSISIVHPGGEGIFRQPLENELSAFAWLAILFAGVIQSCGTYGFVTYATTLVNSSLLAALYNGLMPVFVAVEAIVLLGESMTEEQIFGGAIILAGWICAMIATAKENREKSIAVSRKEAQRTV